MISIEPIPELRDCWARVSRRVDDTRRIAPSLDAYLNAENAEFLGEFPFKNPTGNLAQSLTSSFHPDHVFSFDGRDILHGSSVEYASQVDEIREEQGLAGITVPIDSVRLTDIALHFTRWWLYGGLR